MVAEVSCFMTPECGRGGKVCAWAWSIGLILSSSDSPHFWLCRGGFGYIYSSVTEGLGSASPWGQSGQDSPGSPGVLVGQTDNKQTHKRTRKPLVQSGHRMRCWEGSGQSVEASEGVTVSGDRRTGSRQPSEGQAEERATKREQLV